MSTFNKADNTAMNERIYNAIADAAVEVCKHITGIADNSYTAAELSEKVNHATFEDNYLQIESKDIYVDGKMHHIENYLGPYHEISVDTFSAKIADAYIFQYLYKVQKALSINKKVQRDFYIGAEKNEDIALYSFCITDDVMQVLKAADTHKNFINELYTALWYDAKKDNIVCCNGASMNVLSGKSALSMKFTENAAIDADNFTVTINGKQIATDAVMIPAAAFKKAKKNAECNIYISAETAEIYAVVSGKKVQCITDRKMPNYESIFPYLNHSIWYDADFLKGMKSFASSIYTNKDHKWYAVLSGTESSNDVQLSAYYMMKDSLDEVIQSTTLHLQSTPAFNFAIAIDMKAFLQNIAGSNMSIYIPESIENTIVLSNQKDMLSLMMPMCMKDSDRDYYADRISWCNDVAVKAGYNRDAFRLLNHTWCNSIHISASVSDDSMLEIFCNDNKLQYAEKTVTNILQCDMIRLDADSADRERLETICWYLNNATEIDDAAATMRDNLNQRYSEVVAYYKQVEIDVAEVNKMCAEITGTDIPGTDTPATTEIPEITETATESFSTPADDIVSTDTEKSAEIASGEDIAVSTDNDVPATDTPYIYEVAEKSPVEEITSINVPDNMKMMITEKVLFGVDADNDINGFSSNYAKKYSYNFDSDIRHNLGVLKITDHEILIDGVEVAHITRNYGRRKIHLCYKQLKPAITWYQYVASDTPVAESTDDVVAAESTDTPATTEIPEITDIVDTPATDMYDDIDTPDEVMCYFADRDAELSADTPATTEIAEITDTVDTPADSDIVAESTDDSDVVAESTDTPADSEDTPASIIVPITEYIESTPDDDAPADTMYSRMRKYAVLSAAAVLMLIVSVVTMLIPDTPASATIERSMQLPEITVTADSIDTPATMVPDSTPIKHHRKHYQHRKVQSITAPADTLIQRDSVITDSTVISREKADTITTDVPADDAKVVPVSTIADDSTEISVSADSSDSDAPLSAVSGSVPTSSNSSSNGSISVPGTPASSISVPATVSPAAGI